MSNKDGYNPQGAPIASLVLSTALRRVHLLSTRRDKARSLAAASHANADARRQNYITTQPRQSVFRRIYRRCHAFAGVTGPVAVWFRAGTILVIGTYVTTQYSRTADKFTWPLSLSHCLFCLYLQSNSSDYLQKRIRD